MSMSIMGAGAGDRVSKVRWTVLKDILLAWVLTVPITALLSASYILLFTLFLKFNDGTFWYKR
ncbi:MAG: inorganic phosphate transporter [Sphingobacteriales bacterium]|nr:inorganic phosphate transporter [Sphingobacteriales bacterium]